MVVPPTCPGLCIEILVNAQPLKEYDNIEDCPEPPNTVTKYIEAQSAAEFAVRVTIDKNHFLFPAGDIEIDTKLDGESARRQMCNVRSIFSPGDKIIDRRRVRLQSGTEAFQKFHFTALEIVDGPAFENVNRLQEELQSTGTISVQLGFVQNKRTKDKGMKYVEPRTYSQIPESALNGDIKTHYASMGPIVPSKPTKWATWDIIGNGPFVTVNFKYRSLAALRALGVIPREATPLPLEERPEEDLSADELRQVVRLLKDRDLAALKIKQETSTKRALSAPTEPADSDEVVIVAAPDPKRRRGGDQEIIVLD